MSSRTWGEIREKADIQGYLNCICVLNKEDAYNIITRSFV